MTARADRVQLFLFYDSKCELCRRFKEWLAARDREGIIQALELDDPELAARFPDVDFERAREQLTVRDREGNLFQGLAALRRLARHLPGIRRLDWIYRLPGMKIVAGGLYRTVNRYRTKLCLSCGEKWTSSRKYSERKRRQSGRRRRS